MTLLAAGFNAWRQLRFTPLPEVTEPHDLVSFTKVLEHDNVDYIRARLSYTIGTVQSVVGVPKVPSLELH